MKKVGTIGSATEDVFIFADTLKTATVRENLQSHSYLLFELGTKNEAHTLHYAIGGGSANLAVGLSRLGYSVTPFFKIGLDEQGKRITDTLALEGLNLEYIIKNNFLKTPRSFIIPAGHNHIAIVYHGNQREIAPDEYPQIILEDLDLLFIGPLSEKSQPFFSHIIQLARQKNILIACNPSMAQIMHATPEFISALKQVDILITNAHEARALFKNLAIPIQPHPISSSGPKLYQEFESINGQAISIANYYTYLLSLGIPVVVTTNGNDGVYAANGETLYYQPSPKVEVVSALGAGDAFSSGFIASYLQDKIIDKALSTGIVNASAVLQSLDAQSGLLSLDELEKNGKN